MTAPNQWTADQMSYLSGLVQSANAAVALGTQAGNQQATALITQYYSYQAGLGRGYAKRAAGVVTNTTFEGQVAIDVLQNVGGSQVTPTTQTQLLVNLASSDYALMAAANGTWPTMFDIEAYHYNDYRILNR